MTADTRAGSLRVFFALWPDVPLARRLHACGRRFRIGPDVRLMQTDTLHLTLVFLGDVALARIGALKAVADGIEFDPFELQLNVIDCWPRKRITWIGASETPDALLSLAGSLSARLDDAGFAHEHRRFVPHLTLLRRSVLPAVRQTIAPLPWPVRSFVLVASRRMADGAHYEVLGRWSGVRPCPIRPG
ncbi:RNA 2',3'-cyclic phosphodiesterase [Rhodocyclaceae bacterium SMB388]